MTDDDVNFEEIVLWSLWLPITHFASLRKNVEKELSLLEDNRNSTWSWIIFNYHDILVTIDSLGFIYLEHIKSIETFDKFLDFLSLVLNDDTKIQITDTFLNRYIGYDKGEEAVSPNQESIDFKEFLKNITVPFESIENKIKLEYIYSSLYVDLNRQENNDSTVENKSKYKISSIKNMKFSLDTEKFELDRKFQTILNRNFENLLKKSIHFTHSLNFEHGEIYALDILDIKYNITDWINFELFINESSREDEKDKIFTQILKKSIQDTIEEYTIFNFLKVTRREYLLNITDEITKKNRLLKKLNAYLLDDTGKSLLSFENGVGSIDDEATIEIFIQNLLQSMPKFYIIDSKIKEAYYVKIGNTSTNLRVKNNETIVNTLYYAKWKSSILFFVETATKVNDSLTMYHQNKTLKELEDISYNANYQADIEDIRELQKNKLLSFDEMTKKILFLVAIAALAGEAPLISSRLFFDIPIKDVTFLQSFGINTINIFFNSSFYGLFIYNIIRPFFLDTDELANSKSNKKLGIKRLWNCFNKKKRGKVYVFDESDYDKHEHRSNKLLLSYNENLKDFEKIYIEYNNSISSYQLVELLKEIDLTQYLLDTNRVFKYHLFPKILHDAPLDEEDTYVHRENYRISGNDRIATKVMYRYKISNLKLEELLTFMKEDDFLIHYGDFLINQGFSLKDAYNRLEPKYKDSSFLTLYIVYSFVLKFNNLNKDGNYRYTISKDQFRVHYHINKLEYKDKVDFEAKQGALATLIDIYFISRLKRLEKKS